MMTIEMSIWFTRYGYAEVHPNLMSGAYPLDGDDVARLAFDGVEKTLNLCQDLEYPLGVRETVEFALREAGIEELRRPLVDFGNLPGEAIGEAAAQVMAWLDAGNRVYLHCRAGRQRSATVAAAVIAMREGVEPREALVRLAGRRLGAEPLPHQREDLLAWWASRVAG